MIFIITEINFLFLAAHFFRRGNIVTAIFLLLLPLILFYKNRISKILIQIGLIFSLFIWSATFLEIWSLYSQIHKPFSKAAAIIICVIIFNIINLLLCNKKA